MRLKINASQGHLNCHDLETLKKSNAIESCLLPRSPRKWLGNVHDHGVKPGQKGFCESEANSEDKLLAHLIEAQDVKSPLRSPTKYTMESLIHDHEL